MKVIFEEYSGMIITGVAVVALVGLITVLLATNGPVNDAFGNMLDTLFSKVTV